MQTTKTFFMRSGLDASSQGYISKDKSKN